MAAYPKVVVGTSRNGDRRNTQITDSTNCGGQSWSRPGTPTDNPVCERFIGTLKREEIWVRPYVDYADARNSIGPFIEDYNENRSHSSLGKQSPAEFERMYHQAAKSQPAQAEPNVP